MQSIRFYHIYKTASSMMLLAVLLSAFSCMSNKPEEIKALIDDQKVPSLEIEDYISSILDSGRVKYRLETPLMKVYDKLEKPYREFPQGGHIITYDSLDIIKSEIKCKYAINHYKAKMWDLRTNVEAVNEDGVVFNTEQLYWNEGDEKIYTDKFVKIITKDKIITGYGMEATQNFKVYEIKKVSAQINIKDQELENKE